MGYNGVRAANPNLNEDPMIQRLRTSWIMAVFSASLPFACGHDNPPPPEQTGSACTVADTCYPNVDGGALQGGAKVCLTTTFGYCTHICTADTDCCAVPGECNTPHPEVCSPFQSLP